MSLSALSIKRPIFISCIVTLILAVGYISLKKLAVDLFPNITFPIVNVTTVYPGTGPAEIETLVSKIIEDEVSTLTGIKNLSSINREGLSIVIAEFGLETDIKYAEQQIRDRVSAAKSKLPTGVKEPVIRRIDPSDQPILLLSVTADLPIGELYELADQKLRPKFEQIPSVGLVEIQGGRKREIQVKLDRKKLKSHELSASMVANRLAAAGQNIPAGKFSTSGKETIFRTLGEFHSPQEIGKTIVSFFGSETPVTVNDLGKVVDTLEDETSRAFHNGKTNLILRIFRQSGANTVQVSDTVKSHIASLNQEFASSPGHPEIRSVYDGAKFIRANVEDVKESIFIGIALTVIVVFLFLGSIRSTVITGLALPNSLIGAFILMASAGFSINVMTLLALSLTVGLLIDDAIVVRENIFRHVEMGKKPMEAALEGTQEVTLAVIATTLTVIAVFGPIGFLQGMVGKFFKEFGLTICFAMAISLFDALTVAPMLSAYFAGTGHLPSRTSLWGKTIGRLLYAFDRFQNWLEDRYISTLHWTLRYPLFVIGGAIFIFIASIFATRAVPKTFLPAQDMGQFQVMLDLPPGTNIEAMTEVTQKVDITIRNNPEVIDTVAIVGGQTTPVNEAQIMVNLVPSQQRKINTTDFKEKLRQQLKDFQHAHPRVQDIDMVAAGQRPFNLNISGTDLKELETYSQKIFERLKSHPGLKDVDISYRPGKPEFQIALDTNHAEKLGVSTVSAGMELRTQIEGVTPAVFREKGREYNIRVRLLDEQRNLQNAFAESYIPNINQNLIRLKDISQGMSTVGPSEINRQNRARYIRISGDITPGGVGMGAVMKDSIALLENELKLPYGFQYRFVGQAENFKELGENMLLAMILGTLFIYLVLASLYESFITPMAIMLVLPLAACGAFYALLITHQSLDLFSMIGCVMLLGVATKNSILLVDSINQHMAQGQSRTEAILIAGKTRLRPILMTSIALIVGMLPVAIGLNEASRQRVSMGIAIIGGLISSTALTLVVIPATYSFIDRLGNWVKSRFIKYPQQQ